MAISSLYYLNAPSLGSATAVFTDSALSICAPNGYYSNGVIVREQVGCILLPQQNCATCPTYNCVEGTCVDPGDGSGTYDTLVACEAACAPPVSYNCVEGTCTDPGDGTGTYATLVACEAACSPPPPVSYNCVEANCVDPGDGTGTYATLVACEAVCGVPPPVSYNCVSGVCTDPGDGTGTYATLVACEAACGAPTISLGSPICRENNCNDNAACSVRYGINTTNAPVGSYITRTTGFPSSTANVTVSDSTPPTGEVLYFEPSGSATPVYFDLELRDSGGTIIATSSTSLTHQSFWPMLPLC